MLNTPQLRAASLTVGFGIVFPTLLASFTLNKPDRSQVAGSYRFDLHPVPQPADLDWVSVRVDSTSNKRGGD